MSAVPEARRYRFAALQRTGLFGAVPPTLLVTLSLAVIGGWAAVLVGAPLVLVALPLVVGGLVGFGRVGGQPIHALVPHLASWAWRRLRRRQSWCRPVPLLADSQRVHSLPPALAGLELFDVDLPRTGGGATLGVVRDRPAGAVSAVLRVAGDGQFALTDAAVQDAKVDLWGLALAGFCREGAAVSRTTWHEWNSPTGVGDHKTDLESRWVDEPETPARHAYLALVDTVAPTSVRHEVLLTITVDLRRVRRRSGMSSFATAVEALGEEVRLFGARLEHAGLRVDPPLRAAEIIIATRTRSDPSLLPRLTTLQRSLAAASGRAAPVFGPMAVDEGWAQVRVDGAVHRTWWFARWPRREVPAGWLDQLLFGVHATRTVTVVFEPIAPSRSDRDVDKEAVSRETNADDRARRGFRVRAVDRKATREVTLREQELASGFTELAYAGLITVTASTAEALDDLAGVVEQTAAQAGVELQPLFARQAAGWVASLPVGRTLARRITT